MNRFQDRVAIVTGAAGGIGRATVIRLAQEGCRVIASVRRPADCEDLIEARSEEHTSELQSH